MSLRLVKTLICFNKILLRAWVAGEGLDDRHKEIERLRNRLNELYNAAEAYARYRARIEELEAKLEELERPVGVHDTSWYYEQEGAEQ